MHNPKLLNMQTVLLLTVREMRKPMHVAKVISSIFYTTYRELKYSMKLKSGMHKERRQYSEGTNRRSKGGYVMDHNTTR